MKLYTKILLCTGVSALFAGQAIVVYSRRVVHAALLSELTAKTDANIRDDSGAYARAIQSGDELRLLPMLESELVHTDAEYGVVLDLSGRVLSHTNVVEVGRVYVDGDDSASLKSDRTLARELQLKGRSVLDVSVPIFAESTTKLDEDFLLAGGAADMKGRRVGTLRFGLPLAQAERTERLIVRRIQGIVLFAGCLTGLLLFAVMRRLLAPIGLLSAATAAVGRGHLGSIVAVTSEDELGALAKSFNAMARELGSTMVSKKFFNDILDHLQDQVIVADAAGAITLVNPAVITLLGYSRDELTGRPAASLLGPGAISFTAPTRGVSATLVAKDGTAIPVLFSASPITDAAGAVTGWIGAAKDISDLKKLEARVHQSEKLSAVGQLAAGVAHEINNPLGVILGFAQTMSRELQPGDQNELPVTSIEREALRCKALVQNLLTFSRTSHTDLEPTDLNAAVTQSLSIIEPQAKLGRVKISARLAEGLPQVLANKGQLEQIVMNLAKNSIDAMPGGGALELTTELLEDASRSWVCMRIVDDGTGIPEAIQSKIFEPFFTTKPIGLGTGLGLSLVSEIVLKHAGEFSVESRPGRTAFTIKLPSRPR